MHCTAQEVQFPHSPDFLAGVRGKGMAGKEDGGWKDKIKGRQCRGKWKWR